MNDTTDNLRAVVSSGLVRPVGGPSYCDVCNEWPASMTNKGMRCHMCWTRDVAAAHPVPLPDGKQCLQDLASIGVPGAAQKLAIDTTQSPGCREQRPCSGRAVHGIELCPNAEVCESLPRPQTPESKTNENRGSDSQH